MQGDVYDTSMIKIASKNEISENIGNSSYSTYSDEPEVSPSIIIEDMLDFYFNCKTT